MSLGKVQLYHGMGRGKTTSSIGQVVRLTGHNMKGAYAQFMKSPKSGEVEYLKSNKLVNYFCYGDYELIHITEKPDNNQEIHTEKTFEFIEEVSNNSAYNFLVCDEILTLLSWNIDFEDRILNLIKNKNKDLELILTGHYCTDEILRNSDVSTHYVKQKHTLDQGIKARRGVEY